MKPLAPLVPAGPEETWSQLAAVVVRVAVTIPTQCPYGVRWHYGWPCECMKREWSGEGEPTLSERPARLKSTAP